MRIVSALVELGRVSRVWLVAAATLSPSSAALADVVGVHYAPILHNCRPGVVVAGLFWGVDPPTACVVHEDHWTGMVGAWCQSPGGKCVVVANCLPVSQSLCSGG
jgi:hypothetical protein